MRSARLIVVVLAVVGCASGPVATPSLTPPQSLNPTAAPAAPTPTPMKDTVLPTASVEPTQSTVATVTASPTPSAAPTPSPTATPVSLGAYVAALNPPYKNSTWKQFEDAMRTAVQVYGNMPMGDLDRNDIACAYKWYSDTQSMCTDAFWNLCIAYKRSGANALVLDAVKDLIGLTYHAQSKSQFQRWVGTHGPQPQSDTQCAYNNE